MATLRRPAVPGLRLGAPGVYAYPASAASPGFQPVRLDIAAFVGVALRGPVAECTPVASWSEYERIFGGYERPNGGPDRMLPYAVAAFFAQGGESAYVVRVAPPDPPAGAALSGADATARYRVGEVCLAAASEGTWGDNLAIGLGFAAAQAFSAVIRRRDNGFGELECPPGLMLVPGDLLRLRGPGTAALGEFRWVVETGTDLVGHPIATLDAPAAVDDATVTASIVTATLSVADADPQVVRRETVADLGLHPIHPRFLGRAIDQQSDLVRVVSLPPGPLTPSGPLLPPLAARLTQHGADRWASITGLSFYDDDPPDDDPLDERPHRGADLAGRQPDIGILCVPDLLWQWPEATVPRPDPPPAPSPCFVPWPPEQDPPAYQPPPAGAPQLDPRDPAQLDEIVRRQRRVVDVAELRRRFVVVLDVPPDLVANEVTRWRAFFDTSYAAAYHPWLRVPRQPATAVVETMPVPPSIFAAGIIAGRERRLGLARGPANELAAGAVAAAQTVTDAEHDRLHLTGINVFRAERDGYRLSAARTLATDPSYRQLSVRRLMTMLALTLERQSQWLVFEPNTATLRQLLTQTVVELLRSQLRDGSFAGDTEEESFFVQCDDGINPRQSQEQGRLIAVVGVAPASPLEYLVLRIAQDTDGRVQVEAPGG